MMQTNTNHRRLFRRSTAAGLALLLISVNSPTAEAGFWVKRNWSRVQRVAPGTRTAVRLYKDRAPRGKRKIEGHFHSATAESITLTLPDGKTRTLRKRAVRRVLVYRPLTKRYQGWITAGIGTALWTPLLVHPESDVQTEWIPILAAAFIIAPAAIAFLAAPKWGGIYNVPRKLRDDPAFTPPPKPAKQSSSATVSGVTEAGGSPTGSGLGDLLLNKESGPEWLRWQARRALVRKGLPLDLPDLTVRSLSAERAGRQTTFDSSVLGTDDASWRARLD